MLLYTIRKKWAMNILNVLVNEHKSTKRKNMGKTLDSKKRYSRCLCKSFMLVVEDPEEYRNCLRMTRKQFDILLNLGTSYCKKWYINEKIYSSTSNPSTLFSTFSTTRLSVYIGIVHINYYNYYHNYNWNRLARKNILCRFFYC